MSGQIKGALSAWNVDTLKEYVESRFADMEKAQLQRFADSEKAVNAALAAAEKAVQAALVAQNQAVEKSEANSEKWRQNANEWRGAMGDRETRFALRGEMDGKLEAITSALQSMKEALAAASASRVGSKSVKDESRANMAIVISLVGGFVGLAGLAIVVLRVLGK